MYKPKILLVEDDQHLQIIIKKYIDKEGYHLDIASTGEEGIDYLNYDEYHLAILDVMLPDMEGWTILRHMRNSSSTPVIMLTALGQEEDKLHGFELGADDYVTKPFSAKELMARIKIQLRHQIPSKQNEVIVGDLRILPDLRQVSLKGEPLSLTSLEYQLLSYFLDNQHLALSRQQLLDNVWGIDYYGDVRTVDTHVKRLRKKLETSEQSILTVRGYGYKWGGV